jgi:hypothetical protein
MMASRRSIPEVGAIERTILHGFGHVCGFDALAGGEVGDGARDLQNAVVRARGESEAVDGLDEEAA